MESMRENKPLLLSLLSTGSFILLLATGWSPDLCHQFGIIEFPETFRSVLIRVLAIDFFLSLIVDRICLMLFGEGKLRNPI